MARRSSRKRQRLSAAVATMLAALGLRALAVLEGEELLRRPGLRAFAVTAPSGRKLPKRPKSLDQKEEYQVPGTLYQGGRRGVQFFLGDMVECQRNVSGNIEWQTARVSRAPTDERPNDGSFRVKWDDDATVQKCWYRDLRKPKDPEKVKMPDWVEDWWPEEPPPEPDYVGNESDPDLNFVIKGPFPKEYTEDEMFWRKGPPQPAYEILEEEHKQDAERWKDFRKKEAERKTLESERKAEFEESERKWRKGELKKMKQKLDMMEEGPEKDKKKQELEDTTVRYAQDDEKARKIVEEKMRDAEKARAMAMEDGPEKDKILERIEGEEDVIRAEKEARLKEKEKAQKEKERRHNMPYEENLEAWTVTELKAELKSKGLPVTGNKPDLVERLRAAGE
eukprot:TRINITY_DN36633_c0_g1_i1.p1 TRINITY_DN36633_c0_g1~~TRINITY_DN36633_c0_g1_i1.p1  ORF type:complete len:417 (+),score=120.42 TRINITY_DN36633_c0_g1_i1:70-1251(+)